MKLAASTVPCDASDELILEQGECDKTSESRSGPTAGLNA
jgi:hypothetical protein